MKKKAKRMKTNEELIQEIMNETLQKEEAREDNCEFVATIETKIQENEEQLKNYCSLVNYKLNGRRFVEVEGFKKLIAGELFREYSNNIQDYMTSSEYTLEDLKMEDEELEDGFVLLTEEEREEAIKNEQKRFFDKFEELFVQAIFHTVEMALKGENNYFEEESFCLA